MDALLLQAVVRELRDRVSGASLTRVDLVGDYALLLRFTDPRADLFLSAHPELSRVSLVRSARHVGEPRRAPDSLSETLTRSRLAAIDREQDGRVATFAFEKPGSRHELPRLVAELIPRFANVVLVGNDDRILWARREFGPGHTREVRTGRRYEAPPPDRGIPFVELHAEALAARLAAHEGPLHRRIPAAWGGGSTGFARVLEATGADFPARLLDLAIAARHARPRLARTTVTPEQHVLFPADPGPLPGWEVLPEISANETADRFYRPQEEAAAAAALFAELRRTLVKRRSKAAKALVHVERRTLDAESADLVREQAELLSANLAKVRKGQASVTLTAFDGARDVSIDLDAALDPHANVEALFKRARRLARGREDLASQRSGLQQEIDDADRALAELDPMPSPSRVIELVREHAPGLLAPRDVQPKEKAARPGKPAPKIPGDGFNPRRYVLPGGWEVWVGRSAKQNDELTHRWAAPRDLWFHARGCEGSHAVLRLASGKGEPPREIIEAAAAIAAFHSKARNSKLVPVAWTERRHVRKPRGAPVGTASIQREKVVFVAPR